MRQEKQLLLDEIKDQIEGSDAFVVARYQKMNSLATSDFRNALHEAGASFEVVRKRVFLKAAESAGIDSFTPEMLEGSVGVVFANEDTVAAAKAVCTYQKESKGIVEVLCGYFDNKLVSDADVKTLSELPSKDEMRGTVCRNNCRSDDSDAVRHAVSFDQCDLLYRQQGQKRLRRRIT